MGYDAITRLQRRVTRADESSVRVRLCILMCGERDECVLPKQCVYHIANAVEAAPIGGKAFVSCKFEEHMFVSQKRWGELYEQYLKSQSELKALWREKPDMKLEHPHCGLQLLDYNDAECECLVQECIEAECIGAACANGLTPQKLTSELDGRQWCLHQLFTARGARPLDTGMPPVFSCMVTGLPGDTALEYKNPFEDGGWGEDGYGSADEHDHCFCYLDGLLAVDWNVDYLSPVRSGFRKQEIVCEQVCSFCKTPIEECGGYYHNCPSPLANNHRKPHPLAPGKMYTGVAGPIISCKITNPLAEVTEWSGKIGGKTRLEYIQGVRVGKPSLISLLEKYRAQFAKHGVDAGDFRVIMFFNC